LNDNAAGIVSFRVQGREERIPRPSAIAEAAGAELASNDLPDHAIRLAPGPADSRQRPRCGAETDDFRQQNSAGPGTITTRRPEMLFSGYWGNATVDDQTKGGRRGKGSYPENLLQVR